MQEVIQVHNITKTYNGYKAVSNLDFSVKRGSVLGLLGANGAGKSTSIECILGIKKWDCGEAKILGMDPLRDRKKLFQRIGVQFQEANYQTEIKVDELCRETAALYGQCADWQELLVRFGIGEKEKSAVKNLSGGERQRLFIILALIPNPEIVFLDELTTGLDARARRDVWSTLEELKKKGMTMLLTSHFMDEVEALCDEIIILKKGKTIFQGTVGQAVNSSPYDKFEEAYLWYTDEEADNENI